MSEACQHPDYGDGEMRSRWSVQGNYARPVRQMRAIREVLIHQPPDVGHAVTLLEQAILDLGGRKSWGAPDDAEARNG